MILKGGNDFLCAGADRQVRREINPEGKRLLVWLWHGVIVEMSLP